MVLSPDVKLVIRKPASDELTLCSLSPVSDITSPAKSWQLQHVVSEPACRVHNKDL